MRFGVACFGILRLACGNRHRRAGVRGAGSVRHAGFDIERVEAAGIFQRMQGRITHLREEGRVGVEQPVEPVDQNADRQQIEQRLVAPGFAACRRLGWRQPFGLRGDRRFACGLKQVFSMCVHRRDLLDNGLIDAGDCGRRLVAHLGLEPGRQLPRQFVEGAVLDRRQRRRLAIARGAERQNVLRRFRCGVDRGFHGVIQIGWV